MAEWQDFCDLMMTWFEEHLTPDIRQEIFEQELDAIVSDWQDSDIAAVYERLGSRVGKLLSRTYIDNLIMALMQHLVKSERVTIEVGLHTKPDDQNHEEPNAVWMEEGDITEVASEAVICNETRLTFAVDGSLPETRPGQAYVIEVAFTLTEDDDG